MASRGVPRERVGDELRGVLVHVDLEDLRRAHDDLEEILGRVVVELLEHAEARAERLRQEPLARRRPDEREGRDLDLDRPRVRALVDEDVDGVVLHRRVEVLLDGDVDAVDLVDEEDVELGQLGEDAGEVGGLFEDGAGGGAELGADLARDDVPQRGLAQPRRAGEEDVVERLAALARRLDVDLQVLDDLGLPDELVEASRPELRLVLHQVSVGRNRDHRVALRVVGHRGSRPNLPLPSGEGRGEGKCRALALHPNPLLRRRTARGVRRSRRLQRFAHERLDGGVVARASCGRGR